MGPVPSAVALVGLVADTDAETSAGSSAPGRRISTEALLESGFCAGQAELPCVVAAAFAVVAGASLAAAELAVLVGLAFFEDVVDFAAEAAASAIRVVDLRPTAEAPSQELGATSDGAQ